MTQILKTTYKDIRLTSSSIGSAHQSSRRRVSAFAQTIAARYSKGQFHWSAVNLTLRQSQPALVTHSTNQQTHLHIRPHLSLTFASGKDRGAESNIEQPIIIERIQETLLKPVLRHRIGEVMIERMVARQVRLNNLSIPGEVRNIAGSGDRAGSQLIVANSVSQAPLALPSNNTVPIYQEAAMPVPRVLRRNAIKESSDSANDSKAKQAGVMRSGMISDQMAIGLSQQRSGQMRTALSDQDLSRLTDQVVKSIDKRIIAARERVGRS